MTINTNIQNTVLRLIHITTWMLFLLLPLLIHGGNESIDWKEYLYRLPMPITFMFFFYANYCFLIDRFLFQRQKMIKFITCNLLLIVLANGGIHIYNEYRFRKEIEYHKPKHQTENRHNNISNTEQSTVKPFRVNENQHQRMRAVFFLRDFVTLSLIIALAVAIRATGRWYESENQRRELEKSKTEAELKNLKNQLNPHFLLNTLNNIYALIAFDSEKAQNAVQELSRLLRHILYTNQDAYILLTQEVDFICNYIELMRIRLNDNAEVRTQFHLRPRSNTKIAPLLFISLIENAFKHGISATEKSFINISIEEHTKGIIVCHISNSYHPKNQDDKSGSGIGLEQVRKRLELLYSGQYIWNQGVTNDKHAYESILTISTLKLLNT